MRTADLFTMWAGDGHPEPSLLCSINSPTPSGGGDGTTSLTGTVDLGYAKTLVSEGKLTGPQYNALINGGSASVLVAVLSPQDYALLTGTMIPAGNFNLVLAYNASTQYSVGQMCTLNGGLYQLGAPVSPGTAPPSSGWNTVVAPTISAFVDPYTYVDILSPAFSALGAVATITGTQTTAGQVLSAIPALPNPAGVPAALMTHLDVDVIGLQNNPGAVLPVDCTVDLKLFVTNSNTAQTWVITPEWRQVSVAINAAIAAQAAGVYRATLRYRQRP